MSKYIAFLQMYQIEFKYSFNSYDFPCTRTSWIFVFFSYVDSSLDTQNSTLHYIKRVGEITKTIYKFSNVELALFEH